MPDATSSLLLTCEHASHAIPPPWEDTLDWDPEVLRSPLGWDVGASDLARDFARATGAPLVEARASRLLVELHRSPRHPRLWSRYTRSLSAAERRLIFASHYAPFREESLAHARRLLDTQGRCVHLSVHTFAAPPQARPADIGLLYDPQRPAENTFCTAWRARLLAMNPALHIRRNAPGRGAADGHTTALRQLFGGTAYLGLELTVAQAWPLGDPQGWQVLRAMLTHTLQQTLRAC